MTISQPNIRGTTQWADGQHVTGPVQIVIASPDWYCNDTNATGPVSVVKPLARRTES